MCLSHLFVSQATNTNHAEPAVAVTPLLYLCNVQDAVLHCRTVGCRGRSPHVAFELLCEEGGCGSTLGIPRLVGGLCCDLVLQCLLLGHTVISSSCC